MNIREHLTQILESIIFAAGKPLTEAQLLNLFNEEERPSLSEIRQALFKLQEKYTDSGVELVNIASGYQFQSKIAYATWISRLWEEKPAKYSRALLETLALIAYRQPITRGEIEEIRGVGISTSIFKTLLEDRGWIRVVGHRDVPGRPGLYATTKQFLDYFGLNSLDQLPELPEILALADPDAVLEAADANDPENQLELAELNATFESDSTEILTSEQLAEQTVMQDESTEQEPVAEDNWQELESTADIQE